MVEKVSKLQKNFGVSRRRSIYEFCYFGQIYETPLGVILASTGETGPSFRIKTHSTATADEQSFHHLIGGRGYINLLIPVQGFFVEHIFAQTGSGAFQIGDVTCDLLDRVDLFVQEMSFQEVAQLKNRIV
uniref:LAGLIDADG homing endonuclease n=1 Tax=Romanomermis culicivorax TaxID=13658 RepID=A0A915K795_ROMCU